jgi:hypothetical protein
MPLSVLDSYLYLQVALWQPICVNCGLLPVPVKQEIPGITLQQIQLNLKEDQSTTNAQRKLQMYHFLVQVNSNMLRGPLKLTLN